MTGQDSTYLTGKLLLAMPSIGDGRFDHAVIYICAHDEQGAMGLAVNQVAQGLSFDAVLKELCDVPDLSGSAEGAQVVMNGGPVEPDHGFLLHSLDFDRCDTVKVDDDFGVTSTIEGLTALARGAFPQDFLFILGYAGWTAGQLEAELRQNAWLVCDARRDIVFCEDVDAKWGRAMESLGFDPLMLSHTAGQA